jgi:glycosidase
MDFSFFDKMNKAKQEETDDWWLGLNRIYHSFVYDYLYPDPSSVLAFLDNHDTNRFLHKGRDVLALKQALALLLTVNRIPQIYYGTEVLMNGTTEVSDGYVRKDFPGGFPGDRQNLFERKNHSQAVRSVFSWLSQLLHWRQHCEAVIKGRQTQFIPHKGVYVIARQYQEQTVLTVLNGTSQPATMSVKRYAEVIGSAGKVKDVLSHRFYDLSSDVKLRPRQTLVLDFSCAYI